MNQYMNLSDLINILESEQGDHSNTYLPFFFKINSDKDYDALSKMKKLFPCLKIHDRILSQLYELIKIRNPDKKLKQDDLKILTEEFLKDVNPVCFGSWVYYPWESSLVHLLDEEEFIEVRTSRNLYKITKEEQEYFKTKKVGIIGLSVGQSIALTIAIERLCGELRLADFDTIELSNLNRIRSSIKNIGLSKVIVAAREILMIDPFLKVQCFCNGINEENIEEFIDAKNQKVDLIIEECDSVDIKILSRIYAKRHKIPVVMDTNDRGMIDIERFDIDPDYPILHGLVNNLDYRSIANLSIEEKIKILGPIAGVNEMSTRMKYSLSQIGKTISTWPQLASSVMLGGAIVTDAVRRIFNGEFTKSGRYYVDLESIIR